MVRIACPCPSLSARIENHALNKFARTLKFVRCGLASAPLLPPPPIPLGRTSYQRLMFRLNGCNGVTPLEIQDQRPRRVFSCLPCAITAIQLVVRPQMHTHFAGCGPAPQCFRNGIIKVFSSSPAATARPMSLSTDTRRTKWRTQPPFIGARSNRASSRLVALISAVGPVTGKRLNSGRLWDLLAMQVLLIGVNWCELV